MNSRRYVVPILIFVMIIVLLYFIYTSTKTRKTASGSVDAAAELSSRRPLEPKKEDIDSIKVTMNGDRPCKKADGFPCQDEEAKFNELFQRVAYFNGAKEVTVTDFKKYYVREYSTQNAGQKYYVGPIYEVTLKRAGSDESSTAAPNSTSNVTMYFAYLYEDRTLPQELAEPPSLRVIGYHTIGEGEGQYIHTSIPEHVRAARSPQSSAPLPTPLRLTINGLRPCAKKNGLPPCSDDSAFERELEFMASFFGATEMIVYDAEKYFVQNFELYGKTYYFIGPIYTVDMKTKDGLKKHEIAYLYDIKNMPFAPMSRLRNVTNEDSKFKLKEIPPDAIA